ILPNQLDDDDDDDDEDDDDEHTSLESGASCPIDSEELSTDDDNEDDENDIDAENALTENDVEGNPSCDITTVTLNNPSAHNESNRHEHYSLIVASPAMRSNDVMAPTTTAQTAASAAAAKSDVMTTDPVTFSVLSADIEDIVQHALHVWKNDAIVINNQNNTNEALPFNNEENFLFADFL
ncbi:unnamed protein product, partial [Adineta steineri]